MEPVFPGHPPDRTTPEHAPVQRLSRSTSLAEKAYDEVKSSIISGAMRSDERYAEAALARTLGISRTPLREALRRLQEEGFIEPRGLRGFTVVPVTQQSVRELYDVRCALETLAALRAARTIPADDVVAMAERYADIGRALDAGDPQPFHDSEFEFHDLFVQNCGNAWLIRSIERLRDQLDRVGHLTHRLFEHSKQSFAEHCEILDTMATRDPDELERAVRQHITGVAVRIVASMDSPAPDGTTPIVSATERDGDAVA